MGNQTGKASVKGAKFIDDIDIKTSKTNWIAGMYSLVLHLPRKTSKKWNFAAIFTKQEKMRYYSLFYCHQMSQKIILTFLKIITKIFTVKKIVNFSR